MEYSQVTIALRASELTGPLGRPLLLASLVLDQPQQEIVFLRNHPGGWFQAGRMPIPPGQMTGVSLRLAEAHLVDEFYTGLLFYKGVQEELPIPPA